MRLARLPAGIRVHYVGAGATGGDGRETSPFGSIQEAVDGASNGDVVALSKGTFTEAVRVTRAVTLWGACVSETRLTTPIPDNFSGTVTLLAEGSALRNVTVSGERPGVWSEAPRSRLENVVVENAMRFGIASGFTGRLTRAFFAQNAEIGVLVRGPGAEGILTDTTIKDTVAERNFGDGGRGLEINGGASLSGTRLEITNNREAGVFAAEEGTTVELEDVHIEGTRARECAASACAGVGLIAIGNARVRLVFFEISDNALCGVQALSRGLSLQNGLISRHPIGLNVQIEPFPLEERVLDVIFEEDDRNVDSQALYVPEPSPPPEQSWDRLGRSGALFGGGPDAGLCWDGAGIGDS